MATLFRRAGEYKWFPDADASGAPNSVLLRADNTVAGEMGARALRRGSSTIDSDLVPSVGGGRVHTLYTPTLNGEVYRFAGIDDRVYRCLASSNDFTDFGTEFDGSGDVAFGDDAYQCFFARGTTKKKFSKDSSSSEQYHNWGIAAPKDAPSVTAVTALTTTVMTFASGETGGTITTHEGTASFQNNYAGTANAATSLKPVLATGKASISKKFAADTDFFTVNDVAGGETDLFDIRAYLENPKKVEKITVMFGLGTGTDPFVDDYYVFDWNINKGEEVAMKDVATSSVATIGTTTTKMLGVLEPNEVTSLKSPEQAASIMKRIGRAAGSISRSRLDTQQASPAWGHLSAIRGQFRRVGNTSGRDWKTVRGFKVVYTAVPNSTEQVYFSDAVWACGGERALTGTYKVGFRYARVFYDQDGNEIYTELSPMSPITNDIVLNQQGINITIANSTLVDKDPQVNQIWIYIYGGFLDTYYRVATTGAVARTGMTIDEFTVPAGSDFDTAAKRTRLATHGFTLASGASTGTITVSLRKSESEAMIDNIQYEPGSTGPPKNIIGVAGPWNGRMFVLTSEGWVYPSNQKSPSSFSLFHCIDLRRYGQPYWIAGTSGGIYVGCSKDIIRIAGSGDEEEDHIVADLYGEPLSVSAPPVDSAVTWDGNVIIYRSADGLMQFTGGSLSPVAFSGTSLLWKGQNRHGIQALNTLTGTFRIETDNHDIYMLAPEGDDTDPTSLWRYDSNAQQWYRFTYPSSFLSINREPDGSLLAGTVDGSVIELEVGNSDDGSQIPITIWTVIDDGDNPLARKVGADFQIHGDTGGGTCTVGIYIDGGSTAEETVYPIMSIPGVYRADIADIGTFLRAQARITGSFVSFVIQAFGITYRQLPPQVMVLDTGYIIPPNNGDIAWIIESEIDCISPADITQYIYKDDVLHDSLTITVKPNVRSVYRSVMPRGTKARRIRFVFRATSTASADNPGFEPYSVRVRFAGSGNMTELPLGQGDSGSV